MSEKYQTIIAVVLLIWVQIWLFNGLHKAQERDYIPYDCVQNERHIRKIKLILEERTPDDTE
jgi:hypothetical protein